MDRTHPRTRLTTALVIVSLMVVSTRELFADAPAHSHSTHNFVVHVPRGMMLDADILAQWERTRSELQRTWLGNVDQGWIPRCQVYIHSTREAYASDVGSGAASTNGASLIEVRGRRIVTRRIDLCCKVSSLGLGAFPHELTHVVLADRFPVKPPPAWADEGIAVLADLPEKRRLHDRDLAAAFRAGRCFDTADLMAMPCCPQGESRATFYGQSLSLAKYFVEIGGEHRFIRFLETVQRIGYDQALAEQYGIDNVRELHTDWMTSQAGLAEIGLAPNGPSISLVTAGGHPVGRDSGRPGSTSLETKW